MENPPSTTEQALVQSPTDHAERLRRRPVWGVPVVVLAVLVIAVLFVVGFTGLFANPVRSVAPDGTTTLSGSFEPYQCNSTSCDGYISAGARSVFIVFPRGCAPPARASTITVTGKAAPDLGNASYRATTCS
ncbi:MAG: hypothetical protein WB808_15940 [Candidatus Dormiibacterota bacterium]